MAASFQFQIVLLFTSLCGYLYVLQAEGNVVHLDNSFNDLKKSGFWFVEFYAPWCGHCKQLEPIWEEVGLELMKTSQVVTAKLDCTRFRDLAEEMEIRGFPTIKFFRGGKAITYRGSRSKDALVEYARKASRPILTEFKTTKEFDERRAKPNVFFLFVKDEVKTSAEYEEIVQEVAEGKIAQVVFYSIKETNLPKDVKVEIVPSILVFKDDSFLPFEEGDTLNKTALGKWVDSEKFPAFLLASESNVEELADTGKMIVFITFGKYSEKKEVNKKMGEVVKRLAVDMKHTFGRHFQFAGLIKSDVTESIMMSSAEQPYILVLEPESRVYYMLPSSAISESFESNDLASFLEDIINKKATAYGGRTYIQQLRRIWWDIRGSAKDMWNASPFMALMIFALPVIVVTFIIVMLCCLDPAPENDEFEEEEELEETQEIGEESREGNGADPPVSGDNTHIKAD